MEKREKHNCFDFVLGYANGSIIRFKDGRWARVIAAPVKDNPDLSQERYTMIDRCPWCNKKLDPKL